MDTVIDKTPPTWLTDALDRSESQIAAGQSVPLEPVLDKVRASIGRMKGSAAKPAPRRTRGG
jgi:hypothetical protein